MQLSHSIWTAFMKCMQSSGPTQILVTSETCHRLFAVTFIKQWKSYKMCFFNIITQHKHCGEDKVYTHIKWGWVSRWRTKTKPHEKSSGTKPLLTYLFFFCKPPRIHSVLHHKCRHLEGLSSMQTSVMGWAILNTNGVLQVKTSSIFIELNVSACIRILIFTFLAQDQATKTS